MPHRDPAQGLRKETLLHVKNDTEPDYFGYLTFEKPGKLFTYTDNCRRELENEDINELIEKISNLKDNPAEWVNILK